MTRRILLSVMRFIHAQVLKTWLFHFITRWETCHKSLSHGNTRVNFICAQKKEAMHTILIFTRCSANTGLEAIYRRNPVCGHIRRPKRVWETYPAPILKPAVKNPHFSMCIIGWAFLPSSLHTDLGQLWGPDRTGGMDRVILCHLSGCLCPRFHVLHCSAFLNLDLSHTYRIWKIRMGASR
jgi:hypothetical protein